MIRNVIFDFGGVICRFNRDYLIDAFCEDPADHDTLKNAIFRDWDSMDAGTGDYAAYAKDTLPMLPERLRPAAERFFAEWPSKMPPIAGTWALIGRLKALGYNVFILSNAPVIFGKAIEVFPIVRMMDGIVISAPVKMVKPDKAIFDYALEKFGILPEESIFVDDNPVNAQAAGQSGIAGYAYTEDADALWETIQSM